MGWYQVDGGWAFGAGPKGIGQEKYYDKVCVFVNYMGVITKIDLCDGECDDTIPGPQLLTLPPKPNNWKIDPIVSVDADTIVVEPREKYSLSDNEQLDQELDVVHNIKS